MGVSVMNILSNHKKGRIEVNYSNDGTGTLESECAWAFKQGNKQDAEQLLPQIEQPADIRTTTYYVPAMWWFDRLVSLLHLAAAHGWMDIIIDLITKYKCDTNCKDSHEHTPLHYAASNNHLEVVRYFINEHHCDPMTRDNDDNTPLHYACRYGHLGNIAQYSVVTHHVRTTDGDTLHFTLLVTTTMPTLCNIHW